MGFEKSALEYPKVDKCAQIGIKLAVELLHSRMLCRLGHLGM